MASPDLPKCSAKRAAVAPCIGRWPIARGVSPSTGRRMFFRALLRAMVLRACGTVALTGLWARFGIGIEALTGPRYWRAPYTGRNGGPLRGIDEWTDDGLAELVHYFGFVDSTANCMSSFLVSFVDGHNGIRNRVNSSSAFAKRLRSTEIGKTSSTVS